MPKNTPIIRPDAAHHRMTLEHPGTEVRVLVDGVEVARSADVIIVREQFKTRVLAPVVYFPRASLAEGVLVASEKAQTTCPLKGHNTHYDLLVGGTRHHASAWSYRDTFQYDERIAQLQDRVAFSRSAATFEGAPEA